jgi:hypothetical protein
MRNWLKLGDYNGICDSCGRKFKASTMKKRWDGLFVCEHDYEVKHPQLSLRVRGDKQSVPVPRPESEQDVFIRECNIINSQGIAGSGVSGCMVSGKTAPGTLR